MKFQSLFEVVELRFDKLLFFTLQEDNIPYSRSTYLIDPPTSVAFEHQNHIMNAKLYVEDPMSLYSVVHKERKRNSAMQDTSDSPCSIEHQMNYEDTESEYASELRRQTYLQKIGKGASQFLLHFYRVDTVVVFVREFPSKKGGEPLSQHILKE